ncbi:SpoIIE family protein phosphatase [Streptomyces sp. NPDC046985]|uniref:SpoIIE family protein phosphatase n=1 Tax=Streptomyces sp. NPDC046985 TaxID=3155377 RepID=UPI003411310D
MALLVTILAVDWNTGGVFRILSWVVLVPAISATICGVWTTAAFAVLAMACYVLSDSAWPHQYRFGLPDFILVAAGGVLAVLVCAVRCRGELMMLHMENVAETTRRVVLRPLPPVWGGLEHAEVYLAADSAARIGGDFYDIQPGPHGTRVLVGDVQGKGLGAVETAAALLGTFRESGYHENDLATVGGRLELRMLRHREHSRASGRGDGGRFATAVLLDFPEDDRGSVRVVNFGHEPPLVVGPSGVRQLPYGEALPLGLADLTEEGLPAVRCAALAPGETLLLFTDGVTEARDSFGAFYPLAAEVCRALAADPRTVEPERLVACVRDGTLRHGGGRVSDDTTIFAVRRAAARTPRMPRPVGGRSPR